MGTLEAVVELTRLGIEAFKLILAAHNGHEDETIQARSSGLASGAAAYAAAKRVGKGKVR